MRRRLVPGVPVRQILACAVATCHNLSQAMLFFSAGKPLSLSLLFIPLPLYVGVLHLVRHGFAVNQPFLHWGDPSESSLT